MPTGKLTGVETCKSITVFIACIYVIEREVIGRDAGYARIEFGVDASRLNKLILILILSIV